MKKCIRNLCFEKHKHALILTICVLLTSFNSLSANLAYSQEVKLNVNAKNKTIKEVFDQIEKNSEFILFYEKGVVDLNRQVNVALPQSASVNDVLDKVFEGTSLSYKIADRQILIFNKQTKDVADVKQTPLNVSGIVAAENGEPLIGVGVFEKGTKNGTTTNIDGEYNIKVSSSNAVLEFSYIGYDKQQVPVRGQAKIDVTLLEKASELDEVIVVAYGTQKKSSVTGAIASINSDALKTVTSPNVNSMLQGKIAGVQVLNSSGRPGESAKIRIRGKGTLSGSVDPLWVIDGVAAGTGAQLNPNEIESISVLKDGAATALYGSRATNGVILVTTKTARSGEKKIDISAKLGLSYQHLGKFELMNSRELYDYTASMKGIESQTWFNEKLLQTDTDWFDLATQTALTQNYTVSYTSGTSENRSFLSADYYNEEGTVKGFEYTRFSIRSNNDYKVSNTLTLKTKIAGSYWHDDNKQHSVAATMQNLPWDNPYYEDGTIKKVEKEGDTTGWLGRDKSNYLYNLQYNWARGKQLGVSGTFGVVWNIKDYLTFESNNNIGYRYHLTESYKDPRSISADGGSVTNSNSYITTRYTNQMLRFNKVLKDLHDISAFIGYEYSDRKDQSNSASKKNIIPGGEVLDAAQVLTSAGGNIVESAMQSVFFNANYTYDKKYMGQFSYRVDGSSAFGKDNRYGGFFTVGAGWAIHEEDFIKNLQFVDQLKLRASYGSVGNTPGSGSYGHMSTYDLNDNYYGRPSAFPKNLAYSGLTWEKCYETNIGLDVRLFDRVGLNVDYYHKNTSRLLHQTELSTLTGFKGQWQNVGKVLNEGVEITISPEIIRTRDFQWNAQFNLGFNNATIKELYEGNTMIESIKIKKENEKLDSWYFPEWAGVDVYTGQPMWYTVDADGNKGLTGDYNLADRTSRQIMGSANPKLSGGIMTDVSYKSFTLSAAFTFISGNKIYNYAREFYDNDGAYYAYNSMKLKKGWSRWEKPGDIATHPQPILNSGNNSNKPSSRYLEDGSFFKMNNISLAYTLPQKMIKKVGLKYASVTLSGENIFTITEFSGSDAELAAGSGNNTADQSLYPSVRRFSLGVNLTF